MSKKLYRLFVNGNLYGSGKWEYIQELMNDWVDTCNMYGKTSVRFEVSQHPSNFYEDLVDRGECNV